MCCMVVYLYYFCMTMLLAVYCSFKCIRSPSCHFLSRCKVQGTVLQIAFFYKTKMSSQQFHFENFKWCCRLVNLNSVSVTCVSYFVTSFYSEVFTITSFFLNKMDFNQCTSLIIAKKQNECIYLCCHVPRESAPPPPTKN